MKKLVLISYYFAPLGRADGVNRAYLMKYLAELGWQADVVCCANPRAFLRNFQKDASLLDVIPRQVRVHRVASPAWAPLTGLSSLVGASADPFGAWYKPAVRAAMAECRSPGIVYAVVPPVVNARVAWQLASATGSPLVLDFRDNVHNLPGRIVSACRTVIASTPRSLEEMRRYYGLDRQAGLAMYNGYPADGDPASAGSASDGDRLRIIYAGLLNYDQDPVVLVRALKLMERRHPEARGRVSVDFYGPKNYYTFLFLRRHLGDRIRLRGYLPFGQILKKLAEADVGYSSIRPGPNVYCIPSKVFQYIATGLPVLAAGPRGALSDLIEEQRIGRFSPFHDGAAQSEDIYALLSDPGARAEMKQNSAKISPQFAMRTQVEKLSRHLEALLENPPQA